MKSVRQSIEDALKEHYPKLISWELVRDYEGFDTYKALIDVKTSGSRLSNNNRFYAECCLLEFDIIPSGLNFLPLESFFVSMYYSDNGELVAVDEGYNRSLLCGGQFDLEELVDQYKDICREDYSAIIKDHVVDKLIGKLPDKFLLNRIAKTHSALQHSLSALRY